MAKRKNELKPSSYESSYNGDWYYQPSYPLPAKGVQSRSQRGAFASSWWAKRWLAVLESYGMGSRLQRGRSYARSGQVLNIDVQSGLVTAKVQGSRPTPYRVKMQIKPLSSESWEKVLDAISAQAIFTAQLLDGTMPPEIENAFQATRVPLFPADARDLTSDCSCPDDANPCKHIAAVYYLLGEQFDGDPFLIFTLRGKTREQLIESLRSRRASAADSERDEEPLLIKIPDLREQMDDFWGTPEFDWTSLPLSFPERPATVLKRFDTVPYETQKALTLLYEAMSQFIQTRFLADL